jgi:hypothetical protein
MYHFIFSLSYTLSLGSAHCVRCRSVLIRGSVISLNKRDTLIVPKLPVSVNLNLVVSTRVQNLFQLPSSIILAVLQLKCFQMLTDTFTKICTQTGFSCCSDVNLGHKFRIMFIADKHRSFSLPPLRRIWKLTLQYTAGCLENVSADDVRPTSPKLV